MEALLTVEAVPATSLLRKIFVDTLAGKTRV
jgi:hypothetical protein